MKFPLPLLFSAALALVALVPDAVQAHGPYGAQQSQVKIRYIQQPAPVVVEETEFVPVKKQRVIYPPANVQQFQQGYCPPQQFQQQGFYQPPQQIRGGGQQLNISVDNQQRRWLLGRLFGGRKQPAQVIVNSY